MSRSRALSPVIAFTACLAASSAPATPLSITPLAPRLWMLQGEGGNITVAAGQDATLLVDTGLAEDAPGLRDALQRLGLPAPRWIVNTHFHYDHTGGNAIGGATVIATPALRERLSTPQTLWRQAFPAQPAATWPTLTAAHALTVHLDPQTPVQLLPVPGGHTDGDAAVFFPAAGVLATGDLYFAGMFPIVHPEHGGGLLPAVQRLRELLALLPPDGRVVPGHGPVSTRAELAAWIDMIDFSLAHARQARAAGRTLAELQQAPLPLPLQPYQRGYRTPAQWWETVWKALP